METASPKPWGWFFHMCDRDKFRDEFLRDEFRDECDSSLRGGGMDGIIYL
jgi:hypothetical protein